MPKRPTTSSALTGTLALLVVVIMICLAGSVVSRKVGATGDTGSNIAYETHTGE